MRVPSILHATHLAQEVSENKDLQNISQKIGGYPSAHTNPQILFSDTSCLGQTLDTMVSMVWHSLTRGYYRKAITRPSPPPQSLTRLGYSCILPCYTGGSRNKHLCFYNFCGPLHCVGVDASRHSQRPWAIVARVSAGSIYISDFYPSSRISQRPA